MNGLWQSRPVPLAEGICRTISGMNAARVMVTQQTLMERLVNNYPGNLFILPPLKSGCIITLELLMLDKGSVNVHKQSWQGVQVNRQLAEYMHVHTSHQSVSATTLT